MDVLGPFLDKVRLVHVCAKVTAKERYVTYIAWAEAHGEKVCSQESLALALRERGFENVKGSKGARGWKGLQVRGPLETGAELGPPYKPIPGGRVGP